MSAPPQESTSHAPPPTTPLGTTQTVLSFLGHAAREAPPDAPHTVPSVLGAAQNVLSRLASSSTPHATPAPHHPVPDVLREHPVEVHAPPELPPRAAEPTGTRPAPTSISSHGGSPGGRAITPPHGVARITRSYPALPEAAHPPPRPIRVSHGGVHRRHTGPYADSETAWHPYEDKDPFREKSVGERLEPTIHAAKDELLKATKQATLTGWAQNIALGLQIFIGALTTALGAALTGKKTSVAVSILGGASTLVASFLARTKSSNEPQTSLFRAQALDHFLREIEAFELDYGHEVGDKFDDRIHGFRFGLEKILGNQSGNPTPFDSGPGTNPNAGREKEKWGGGGGDFNTGPSGNGKYPMTTTTKPGLMTV